MYLTQVWLEHKAIKSMVPFLVFFSTLDLCTDMLFKKCLQKCRYPHCIELGPVSIILRHLSANIKYSTVQIIIFLYDAHCRKRKKNH